MYDCGTDKASKTAGEVYDATSCVRYRVVCVVRSTKP